MFTIFDRNEQIRFLELLLQEVTFYATIALKKVHILLTQF